MKFEYIFEFRRIFNFLKKKKGGKKKRNFRDIWSNIFLLPPSLPPSLIPHNFARILSDSVSADLLPVLSTSFVAGGNRLKLIILFDQQLEFNGGAYVSKAGNG